MRGKARGFTLIELIVVIGILAVLAAVLVPSMLGYVKRSRVSQINVNAKTVYSGAQLAIVDSYNAQVEYDAGEIFINSVNGNGVCTGQSSGDICDITTYIGEEFSGYFGFVMDASGTSAEYALWSNKPLTSANFTGMLENSDVVRSIDSAMPIGCHPIKAE